MTQRLVPLAGYLTYPEAVELYQALQQAGIETLVKSCGPPSFPFGEGQYYQLWGLPHHLPAAQPVLALFSPKQAQNGNGTQSCPNCGNENVLPQRRLPWWKKLFFAGTTVFQCHGCGHSFFA